MNFLLWKENCARIKIRDTLSCEISSSLLCCLANEQNFNTISYESQQISNIFRALTQSKMKEFETFAKSFRQDIMVGLSNSVENTLNSFERIQSTLPTQPGGGGGRGKKGKKNEKGQIRSAKSTPKSTSGMYHIIYIEKSYHV